MVTGKGAIEVHVLPGQFIYGRDSAAKDLKMPPSSVRNRMNKLKNMGNLVIKEDRQYSIITIANWETYQSSQEVAEDSKEDYQRTGKGQAKDTDNNDNNVNKIHILIFDHWNSQNIVVHRKLSDKDRRAINSALKDCSSEEILKAISTYSSILKSSDHYFKHKWTLRDFLQRGLPKFTDEADPFTNFKDTGSRTKIKASHQEGHRITTPAEIEEIYR